LDLALVGGLLRQALLWQCCQVGMTVTTTSERG
jgi:hypothetical protein